MTFLLAPGIKGLNVWVGRTSEISIANVDFFCHLDLKRWWLLKLRLFYKSNKRCRAFFDQLVWNFSIVAQLQTWWKFGLFPIVFWSVAFILDKKWSFPLRVSLVNVSKSAVFCGFFHIYWRNLKWENFIYYAVFIGICWCNLPVSIKIID